jgi:hypothetical protein
MPIPYCTGWWVVVSGWFCNSPLFGKPVEPAGNLARQVVLSGLSAKNTTKFLFTAPRNCFNVVCHLFDKNNIRGER